MSRTGDEVKTMVRITDPVVLRLVADEQKRLGDATATKTAGRIIERWFAQNRPDVLHASVNSAPQTPATSAA